MKLHAELASLEAEPDHQSKREDAPGVCRGEEVSAGDGVWRNARSMFADECHKAHGLEVPQDVAIKAGRHNLNVHTEWEFVVERRVYIRCSVFISNATFDTVCSVVAACPRTTPSAAQC